MRQRLLIILVLLLSLGCRSGETPKEDWGAYNPSLLARTILLTYPNEQNGYRLPPKLEDPRLIELIGASPEEIRKLYLINEVHLGKELRRLSPEEEKAPLVITRQSKGSPEPRFTVIRYSAATDSLTTQELLAENLSSQARAEIKNLTSE